MAAPFSSWGSRPPSEGPPRPEQLLTVLLLRHDGDGPRPARGGRTPGTALGESHFCEDLSSFGLNEGK
jgi:hypothetical protein